MSSTLCWLFEKLCGQCKCKCNCCSKCKKTRQESKERKEELDEIVTTSPTLHPQSIAAQTTTTTTSTALSSPNPASRGFTPSVPEVLVLNPGLQSGGSALNAAGTPLATPVTTPSTFGSSVSFKFAQRSEYQCVFHTQFFFVVDNNIDHRKKVIAHLRDLGVTKDNAVFENTIDDPKVFYENEFVNKILDVIFLNIQGMSANDLNFHLDHLRGLVRENDKTYTLICMCESAEQFTKLIPDIHLSEVLREVEVYRMVKPLTLKDTREVLYQIGFKTIKEIIEDQVNITTVQEPTENKKTVKIDL